MTKPTQAVATEREPTKQELERQMQRTRERWQRRSGKLKRQWSKKRYEKESSLGPISPIGSIDPSNKLPSTF